LDREQIQDLLEAVAAGRLAVADAVDRFRAHEVLDLGFARLDTGREHRTGTAEAIFAPGKSDEQLARERSRGAAPRAIRGASLP
jgi:NCAIR mutase (PurE)-related protein